MPSTEGLEVFVRKSQITDEEWFCLIEARRELIRPHLDSFMLPALSMLECMRSEFQSTHMLWLDTPVLVGDERFSLETQGIFRMQPWSAVKRIPDSGYHSRSGDVHYSDGTMRVWGLTHLGLWVLVTIEFVGQSDYKDRGYEKAMTVEIVEKCLPVIIAMIQEKPQLIWEELGKAIKDFAGHRKLLYDQALSIARMVEIEELAFSLVSD